MDERHLLYRVEDGIGTVTINREAQRNAITPEAIRLFHFCLDEAERDERVRVLKVTGAGDKAFCTGAQLSGATTTEGRDLFADYAACSTSSSVFPSRRWRA